jgi:DNA-directed RNA polymerase specialized sigma subunit, sigma24 homolog
VTAIVINAALVQIRKLRRNRIISWDQFEEDSQEWAKREFMIDPTPTAEEICQRSERKRLLEWGMQQLATQTRCAVEQCDLKELSLKEAAGMLGLTVGALKTRLHRGRRSLTLNIHLKTQVRGSGASEGGSGLAQPDERSLQAA